MKRPVYTASRKKFPHFQPTYAHNCNLIHHNIFKKDRQCSIT